MGIVLLEGRMEKGKAETKIKTKQTALEGTEITVEEVERRIRKLKKRKEPGTECRVKHRCMGLKEERA
jgi:hypothetical protein